MNRIVIMTTKFDFAKVNGEELMLQTAYDAISDVDGGWEFMKNYYTLSFMMEDPPEKLIEINNNILRLYDGHSGVSYGYTMRNMEFIAKNGLDKFRTEYCKS